MCVHTCCVEMVMFIVVTVFSYVMYTTLNILPDVVYTDTAGGTTSHASKCTLYGSGGAAAAA